MGIFVFIQLNFLLIGSIYPSLKHLFNSGFLIFGGGHVVLPLLHDWFVDQEIISSNVNVRCFGTRYFDFNSKSPHGPQ